MYLYNINMKKAFSTKYICCFIYVLLFIYLFFIIVIYLFFVVVPSSLTSALS